jgi:hypothetical protein
MFIWKIIFWRIRINFIYIQICFPAGGQKTCDFPMIFCHHNDCMPELNKSKHWSCLIITKSLKKMRVKIFQFKLWEDLSPQSQKIFIPVPTWRTKNPQKYWVRKSQCKHEVRKYIFKNRYTLYKHVQTLYYL